MPAAIVDSRPVESTQWTSTKDEETKMEKASKAVEWYQPILKTLPASTIEVFTKYVGLSSEEEVKAHIHMVRDKAWDV